MRRFWSDREGNIAVLFALAIVPVVGGIGAAVDYSLANSYRTDMQKALDSTALALSRVVPSDEATLQRVGMQYFLASMGKHPMTGLELEIAPGVGKVNLRVTADYSPIMANLVGAGKFRIGAAAQSTWGVGKVEVALVLDNSGSMNNYGRMTHLKDAAHNLLGVLEVSARTPDDAKIAIVPFDQRVKVGTAYVDADWLIWSHWDADNGEERNVTTCTSKKGGGWGHGGKSCTTTREWVPDDHTEWNGCVIDRNKEYDVDDTAPAGSSTKYLASQCDHGLPYPGRVGEMRRLSNDWTALGATIDTMQPSGYTNITIGLVWGMHLLSPTEVATEGAPHGTADLTKYIILMTDGDNTRNRWGNNGWGNDMNKRTEAVCDNIKAAKIEVYTIRLVSGNASLLRNCATREEMYYDVQDAAQLSGVFNAIGADIASLHLSK